MEYYSGIDLHSNNCYVVVSDGSDKVVYGQRLANDMSLILDGLAPYSDALQGVVVESTYNWYWLVDGLKAAGYQVHLANPAGLQPYDGLKHSDDRSDAAWLAHLLRLGVLAEGYIYPPARRGVRDVLRRRSQLVRHRTSQILSVQNQVARSTGFKISANAVRRLDRASVLERVGDGMATIAIMSNLSTMRALDTEIKVLEKAVSAHMLGERSFDLIQTVGGIGRILGLTILLETGDITRFANAGKYASYCRCVSTQRVSNAKKKGVGNARCGNKYLSWAFVEAANFAIRYEPLAKRYYDRKAAKTKPVVARKAIAHKLARACFHVMRDQVPFSAERCFG